MEVSLRPWSLLAVVYYEGVYIFYMGLCYFSYYYSTIILITRGYKVRFMIYGVRR